MTVTEKSSRKRISGVGWVNPLTHDFMLENSTYLKLYADDVQLTLGVDYSVADVGNPAGYVVVITTPGDWSPDWWVLSVETPIDQQVDLSLGGAFGVRFETALDGMARRMQVLADGVHRGLKLAKDSDPSVEYTIPAPEGRKVIGWNEAGTDLQNWDNPTDSMEQAAASAAAAASSAAAADASANVSGDNASDAAASAAEAAASAAEAAAAAATLVVLDEDDMASDSSINPPSQQSVKAFFETVGGITAVGSSTSRTLAARFADIVNALDYGAGPAASAATNQSAFAAAIAAAPAGGVVTIPDGLTFTLDQIVIAKSLALVGRNVTILRSTTTAANALLSVTGGSKVSVVGIAFDGNKANNANPCAVARFNNGSSDIEIIGCEFRNGKASGGYGEGLTVDSLGASFERVLISNCRFHDNDSDGCTVLDAEHLTIANCEAYSNTARGIAANNYDLTLAQKVRYLSVTGNRCVSNGSTGLGVGNFVEDNNISTSPRLYGYNNLEASYGIVSGNVVKSNSGYGIACYGQYLIVADNVVQENGVSTGGNGGGNFALQYSIIRNNLVTGNYFWGFDCGGTRDTLIEGNNFLFNGAVSGLSVPLNIGGGTHNKIIGNNFRGNKDRNIVLIRYEGDGAGGIFPVASVGCVISNNFFQLDAGVYGVIVRDGIESVTITNNQFYPIDTDLSKCILCVARSAIIKDNTVDPAKSRAVAVDGSGFMYIPDVLDMVRVDAAATINGIQTTSQQHIGSGIPWATVTAGGSGYTSEPTVSVTGGGGSGATARAKVRNGAVVQVDMETYGTGYTSAPTLSITGGGGSGATATAQLFLPLATHTEKSIHFNAACTVTKAGSPALSYPAAGNLSVAQFGMLSLHAAFTNSWRIRSQLIA